MINLEIKNKKFYRNGIPHNIYSGTIHYFRIVKEYWYDRLLKAKACGLNTIETYILWSQIEKEEGIFDFSGMNDFGEFIDIAKSLGLDVILRPGPYICAETDFGGFPYWLSKKEGIEYRCNNGIYLKYLERFIEETSKIIVPRLAKNGGNIIMVQVENEYGSFGMDKLYLKKIVDMYKKYGIDSLYFTSDGSDPIMLKGGRIDECITTLNFGSDVKGNKEVFDSLNTNTPFMCMEFWNGWFDCFDGIHHVSDYDQFRKDIKDFLDLDASFNLYMFSGGTNFGFTNGCNHENAIDGFKKTQYLFHTPSYYYDSAITEDGKLTKKFYILKEELEKKTGIKTDIKVSDPITKAYGTYYANEEACLFDNLENITDIKESSFPLDFEDLNQGYGYVLYRTKYEFPRDTILRATNVRDRATIYVNQEKRGIQDINKEYEKIMGYEKDGDSTIDILVENRGRCNYGERMIYPKKGIDGLRIGFGFVMGFENRKVNLSKIDSLKYKEFKGNNNMPSFYRISLEVDEAFDTFIEPSGFSQGVIFVNGFNIGRYDNHDNEPQKTLYIPGPLLKRGANEIVLFETDKCTDGSVVFHNEMLFR